MKIYQRSIRLLNLVRNAPVIAIRQNNTLIRAIPTRFFSNQNKATNGLPDSEYVNDPY